MLVPWVWTPLALLILGIDGSFGYDQDPHPDHYPNENTTVYDTACTASVTCFDTTTIPVTYYVNVTVPHYVNVTETDVFSTLITEFRTTTLLYSVSVTETDSATVTRTQTTVATLPETTTLHYSVSVTETDSDTVTVTETATVSNTTTLHYSVSVTETDSATVTRTETTTATVPATITTYTTKTVISTTVDPCPTECSLSVGTVNLFFWPTDRPYTYPSTYFDASLDYTFTSPSVYMLIPTAVGTNSIETTGPSTTKWILPLDIDEVSTIVDGTVTQQLVLNDLGTDCAQTVDPTAIATLVDSRCDPILAAPKQVSSWAYPCNACQRFGLFDPPYAVPTLPGGLLGTTTIVPATTTVVPTGVVVIVYYSNGKAVSTATVTTTGISGTMTSSVIVSASATATSSLAALSTQDPASAASSLSAASLPTSLPTASSTSTPIVLPSNSTSSLPTPVTGSASKLAGGNVWLSVATLIALSLC